MSEQNKKIDESQQLIEYLQKVVKTEEATEYTYDEMCDNYYSTRERVQDFIERAPKYNGNPETMFEWCENLETYLQNDDGETIQDKNTKRMIVLCIMGAARREIIPFFSTRSRI